MKLMLPLVLAMILSSCALFSKKVDNSAAINKYENKMRSIASSGSESKLQLPPGYRIYKADLTMVGPDGDVVLFYKEGNEIVIKECERYSVINNRADCQSNSRPRRVAVSEFKNRLKSSLRVQNFDTLGQQQADKLKDYREGLGRTPSAEDLVTQRDEARDQVANILKFIDAYGEENANIADLSVLRRRLTELEAKVSEGQKFSDAVIALNAAIETLVDDVIGSFQMNTLSYSRDKVGIEYSILRTYVRPYLAQAAFVSVAPGAFQMGSPSSEKGRDTDEARHRVTISKAFEISATEWTQLQWVVVMGSNPSRFKDESLCPESYMEIYGVSLCSDYPVERVPWNKVKDYLIEYNKRVKDNFEYRLPTEAEWEFAARAGTSTAYSFGDNRSDLGNYAWYSENSGSQTKPVATKGPNSLDIYDVHGNVWEWVEDEYSSDLGTSSVTDPRGSRGGSYHVIRGGSWDNGARGLRSAHRGYAGPGVRGGNLGFRLVRTPK